MVLDEKMSGRSKIEMNLSTEGDRTPGIEDFTQVDVTFEIRGIQE